MDVASARYLLALELFASRVETDADDIAFLYRWVGLEEIVASSAAPRAPSPEERP